MRTQSHTGEESGMGVAGGGGGDEGTERGGRPQAPKPSRRRGRGAKVGGA